MSFGRVPTDSEIPVTVSASSITAADPEIVVISTELTTFIVQGTPLLIGFIKKIGNIYVLEASVQFGIQNPSPSVFVPASALLSIPSEFRPTSLITPIGIVRATSSRFSQNGDENSTSLLALTSQGTLYNTTMIYVGPDQGELRRLDFSATWSSDEQ